VAWKRPDTATWVTIIIALVAATWAVSKEVSGAGASAVAAEVQQIQVWRAGHQSKADEVIKRIDERLDRMETKLDAIEQWVK
jgi:Skp family chaperone for outer membrane proteins